MMLNKKTPALLALSTLAAATLLVGCPAAKTVAPLVSTPVTPTAANTAGTTPGTPAAATPGGTTPTTPGGTTPGTPDGTSPAGTTPGTPGTPGTPAATTPGTPGAGDVGTVGTPRGSSGTSTETVVTASLVACPVATFGQIERLARPAINEGLIRQNAFLNAYNSIPPSADGSTAASSVVAEAVDTLKSFGNSGNSDGSLKSLVTVTGTTTLASDQITAISGADFGKLVIGGTVTGAGAAAAATITAAVGTFTLSANATATAAGVTLTLSSGTITGNTTNGSPTISNVSPVDYAKLVLSGTITGAGIPASTLILAKPDTQVATMSAVAVAGAAAATTLTNKGNGFPLGQGDTNLVARNFLPDMLRIDMTLAATGTRTATAVDGAYVNPTGTGRLIGGRKPGEDAIDATLLYVIPTATNTAINTANADNTATSDRIGYSTQGGRVALDDATMTTFPYLGKPF